MHVAIQISENFVKGVPITEPEELMMLAHEKKSVYHSVWGIKPAAVIINMNFSQVYRMIQEHRLYTTIKLVKIKNK